MRAYRAIALALAVAFVAVGIAFLVEPDVVAAVCARVSRLTGIPVLPIGSVESGLFRVLAAAYMYVVAVLAWMMFWRPAEAVWPAMLAHAKLASATLSVVLCVIQEPSLLLAANGIVDGAIGILALWFRHQAMRRRSTVMR